MTQDGTHQHARHSHVRVFKNVNDLYYSLFEHFLTQISSLNKPNIALATGNTMIPLYRVLTENQDRYNSAHWTCFQLDEYFPISEDTEEFSFHHYLHSQFFDRLKLQPKKSLFRLGHWNPEEECNRIEQEITKQGGIDFGFLGLGRNGHIAFNEPGTELNTRTRLVSLHADTLLANFGTQAPFSQAVTMGIETISDFKKIAIVAIGKSKAAAVRAAIEETQSRQCPASLLQKHSGVTWFLDADAASMLD